MQRRLEKSYFWQGLLIGFQRNAFSDLELIMFKPPLSLVGSLLPALVTSIIDIIPFVT